MKKICFLLLASLILLACDDDNSTGGVIDISNPDTSSSVESSSSKESSSSEIRSSSSIAPSSSSKAKSSSSSKVQSSSSSKKKSSSSSKAKSSSSDETGQSSISSNEVSCSSVQSSSSATGNSSSSYCYVDTRYPYLNQYSPIRIQKATAHPNGDKTIFTFSGGASADEPCYIKETENDPLFTDMDLTLTHVNENGTIEYAKIELQHTKPPFPRSTIDFGAMGVRMIDTAKNQCGKFILYITYIASDDPTNLEKYVSRDSVEFVREPEFCQAEPSSSSSAESINPSIELRINTGSMTTSATKGYSLKNDAEVPKEQAQIQVTENKDGSLTLHGVNGYKVVRYENANDRKWDDDWSAYELPPSPAHTSDFRFSKAKLADSAIAFDCDSFWIVIGPAFNDNTGEDFYAVTLETKERPYANGVRPLEIIYYKK